MGYTVTYGNLRKRGNSRPGKMGFILLTGCFFGLFCVCARYCFPQQIGMLYRLVFPNGGVEELAQRIRAGEGITEAVEAFCQEIFRGQ